ncbi:MAG: AAA family ATPase [Deltaproteobacteria bacterium]|nr:AAA family ATPase [Deltaproteobacteria bacterium]
MKVSIKNLGPIKEADIRINDLTIIAGGNNTGKTYITYAIYGLLKEFENIYPYAEEFASEREELIEKGSLTIPAQQLTGIQAEFIKRISEKFSADIHNIFSAGKDQFSNTKILIDDYKEWADANWLQHPFKFDFESCIITIKHGENGEIIFSFVSTNRNKNISKTYVNAYLYFILLKTICPDPFILPAERQAISLFYKELDINKNFLVEQLQKVPDARDNFDTFQFIEKHTARYALPIKDNIFFTRDIDNIRKKESPLLNICDKIENMLGGYFEQADKEVRFISKVRKKEQFNIPLYLASTSARGFADLYFYLKHKASKGDILMIDEPESHLHPANQILMARLLA